MTRGRSRRLPALGSAASYGALLLLVLAALGPTLWVVVSSFKTQSQILDPQGSVLPSPATLHGYRDVFVEVHLDRYLLNSFIYAFGGTAGAMIAGLLAAYPTARLQFPFRNAFTIAFSLSCRATRGRA